MQNQGLHIVRDNSTWMSSISAYFLSKGFNKILLLFKECPYSKQPWTIQIVFLSPGKRVDLFSVQHNNMMSPSVVKIGKNLLTASLKLEVFLIYGSSLVMQLTMYARVTYPLCPSIWESGLRELKQIMEILLLL